MIAVRATALGAMRRGAGTARADENLLRGPHPFRRDNQISAHVLVASGRGDSMSGTKLAFDYNYKLTGGWIPLWLDFGAQRAARAPATRRPPRPPAAPNTGDVFETLGGVKWTFATPLPLVPYVGAVGGLAFAFPERRVGGERPR